MLILKNGEMNDIKKFHTIHKCNPGYCAGKQRDKSVLAFCKKKIMVVKN
jgi:hypothetical protein